MYLDISGTHQSRTEEYLWSYFCASVLLNLIQKISRIEALGKFISQNTIIINIIVFSCLIYAEEFRCVSQNFMVTLKVGFAVVITQTVKVRLRKVKKVAEQESGVLNVSSPLFYFVENILFM